MGGKPNPGTPADKRLSGNTRKRKPAPNTKAPTGSYALPGGGPGGADAYPINTKKRARAALSYGAQHLPPAKLATVKRKVSQQFPSIKIKGK